ncbi:MAG: GNAT family N-acetyltransferase, partial [Desulfobacterium sp.]|nr:GNAT family N-acetyltransferase [Desulfobacterium sp.]
MKIYKAYYTIKLFIPRWLQIYIRRLVLMEKRLKYKDVWPIDKRAAKPPKDWAGWPDGKKFALVLTHDIENSKGHANCKRLAELEESLGFRSSFNFVAKDYPVSAKLRQYLTDRGFEVAIHGLHHDKNPFRSKTIFQKQAVEINCSLKEWNAVGFRCPSMYHDLEMLHELNIEYDASTFDTDPFEPQPDGVTTIFPFKVSGNNQQKGYIELPYTLPQDFLLYVLMREKNIDIWKNKLDWIADNGGMALFITHPNYISFDENSHYEEYPVSYYIEFLEYIKSKYEGQYWHALPRDVSRYCASKTSESHPTNNDPCSLHTAAPCTQNLIPCTSNLKPCLIDPVNDPRWDLFVLNHPFGYICHLSGWKQILEESFPHMKGHYLAIVDSSDNNIRAALPVFEVRSLLAGNRLVSIPFATICDPLVSSDEDITKLLDAAIDLSNNLGTSRIEIRATASTHLNQDNRVDSVVYNKSHQLSLEPGPEELIKTFSKQVKRKLKKALNSGFERQLAKNEQELKEFYHLYVKTRKRLGLPPQPYILFKLLWEKFSPSNNLSLLMIRNKGQLVAGFIIYKFKDRCSWDYLASDVDFQHLHTNYFGLWEAIKLSCLEGYKIFDFGRTGISNEGLMGFKKLWGTTIIDLPQFYYPKNLCSDLSPADSSILYKLINKVS